MKLRDASRLVGALLNIWTAPGSAIVERWTTITIRFWLIILAAFLAFSEGLLTKIFEWGSSLLSIPPCGVYRAHESAVVIIGGEDGLGQTIALSFSELGYTVFVLYSTKLHCTSGQSVKSTNVSSLLYVWHKKKEQSAHGSWGLVAPISLDTESGAQRAHASETIHAYCVNHSLHLVSVIILPPSTCSSTLSRRHMQGMISSASKESLAFAMWGNSVAHSMIEPILVVEDYVDLLEKTSGRVIMLSTCVHNQCLATQTLHRLLDGVHQRIAQNLSYILDPLGVRVCSVTIGPFEAPLDDGIRTDCEEFPASGGEIGILSKIRLTTRELLLSLTCRQEALCDALHHIVTARYPKYSYSLGVHPFLHRLWSAMPDILRLSLHSIGTHVTC